MIVAKNRRTAGWIVSSVAASCLLGLAPNASAAPRPGGADFSCRASALRVAQAGQPLLEPTVANAPDAPCVDDGAAIVVPTTVGPVQVDAASATTAVTPDNLAAAPAANGDSGAANATITNPAINLAGLAITATAINASASYTCQAGQPVPASASTVSNLTVNGQPVALPPGDAPTTVDVGPLGTLLVNQTVQTPGRVTRRALELRVPNDGTTATTVLGEATADVIGNPCAAAAAPAPPQCSDGIDNDGDGRVDAQDPGCLSGPGGTYNPNDNSEADTPPQCSDGIDNDGDGRVDAQDPGCLSGPGGTYNPNDNDEADNRPQCSDGIDNDGDGKTDAKDSGCLSGAGGKYNPFDDNERSNCSDGIDNDGDGKVDFPADKGCTSAADNSEGTATGRATLRTSPARLASGGVLGACARSSFTTRVAGRRIAKVVFSLDGKRIRTDRSAPYTARISDRRSGTHRVRARVTFVSDSSTKARTLSFRYSRCAAPARSVRFTG